jgi:hypothetical protein
MKLFNHLHGGFFPRFDCPIFNGRTIFFAFHAGGGHAGGLLIIALALVALFTAVMIVLGNSKGGK